MTTEFDVARDALPSVELREYQSPNDPRPTYATVREIDFELDVNKGELSFFYSRADFRTPVNNHVTDLLPLLTRIRDSNFGWDDDDQKEPKVPYSSRLSLRNNQWRYIILKLSRSKNWQFCRDHPPFTLSKKAFNADLYREARRFEVDGTTSRVYQNPAGSGTFVPVRDGSFVAYFVADNRTSGNFEDHGFNIHVDLLYQGTQLRLPIVIDPDVRYPGGSGE